VEVLKRDRYTLFRSSLSAIIVAVVFAYFGSPADGSIASYADSLTSPRLSFLKLSTGQEHFYVHTTGNLPVEGVLSSPFMTAVRSFALPGWGQFHNGNFWKGLIILAIETGLGGVIYAQSEKISDYWNTHEYWTRNQTDPAAARRRSEYYNLYSREFDRRKSMIWLLSGVILYSTLDAYVDAHLAHFDDEGDPYRNVESGK
jgi:hypothetical protein